MNHGVDGEDFPGAEPPAPEEPLPAAETPQSAAEPAGAEPVQPAQPAQPAEWGGQPAPWSAPPPSLTPPPATPSGAPWSAAPSGAPWGGVPATPSAPQPPAPSAAYPSGYPQWAASTPPAPQPAPVVPPAPQPAAWQRDDPWAFTPPPPPPSAPGWSPAWPPAPAPPPRPSASRRTAAVAAVLLFAAAAGASAGVVALTTHGTGSPVSSTQNGLPGPFDGGGGSNPLLPGNGSGGGTGNGGAGGSGGSSSGGANLDQAAIAGKVDPAIVDIVVRLAGGQGTAEGTGMVISGGGQVLTNNHVIDGASTITVQIGGQGSTYPASVVGYDVNDDIALLQIQNPPSNLTTVQIGDPSQLNVGDSVLALGNALGRGGTPTPAAGTVTALDQTITASDPSGQSETLSGLIETNANIQPGDSGGPLVDAQGRVIGMDTAASVAGGRFRFGGRAGEGYAIPIDTAMQIVDQIRNGGGGNGNIQTGRRALLGVEIADSAQGASVQGVQPGSPAESAGIGQGDVITSVGGQQVTSSASLQAAILKHKPGDRVDVTWLDASGGSHHATVTLISGPPA